MENRLTCTLATLLLSLLTVCIGNEEAASDEPGNHERDIGVAWEPAGFGGAGNFLSTHFDPRSPGVVYAASDVAGFFRSTDYGDHWEMRNLGLGNHEISSFAIDPFDPNTLYAGAGAIPESSKAGMYISHDAGLSWRHLASTFTNRITFRKYRTAESIAPDPSQQGVILSGSRDNGVWRSTDGGLSWTQVYAAPRTNAHLFNDGSVEDEPTGGPHPAPVSIVAFDPTNANVVYAGLDGFGVIKSTTGGVADSWQPIDAGLPSKATVRYLAVGSSGVVYAALAEAGVYKSDNGGNEWRPANGALPSLSEDTWVTSVAVHPSNPDIAYLTLATYDYANLWKTTDGGVTWAPKGNVTYDPVNAPPESWEADPTLQWQVTLDRANPDRLFYVGYWDILRSDDCGEHWATKIVGAQDTVVTSLTVDTDHPADQPDTLYATHMDAGLLASTDNGATWRMVVPQTYDITRVGHYWRFATARVGDMKYYYTTSDPWDWPYGQVLRSTDTVNWQRVFKRRRPAGEWMDGAMVGLAVDPSHPSTVYVTQDGGRVFKSTDNGDSWSRTRRQPRGSSFTFALSVDYDGRVFAGTLLDGLWRSTDGGESWDRVLNDQWTIWQTFAAPGAVYVSVEDSNLYRSVDGGDTWERLTDFSPGDDADGGGDKGMAIAVDGSDPDHIFFSRQDNWHPADVSPGIVESIDGGISWLPISAGLGHRSVSALVLGPNHTLFAGAWGGGIWRTQFGKPELSVATTSLRAGEVGQAYTETLKARGGTAPYTWSLFSGALPANLVLDPQTGDIAGAPETEGTYSFTVQVTDAAQSSASREMSITINPTSPPSPIDLTKCKLKISWSKKAVTQMVDSMKIKGTIDASALGHSVEGQQVTVAIGSVAFGPFVLDPKSRYVSPRRTLPITKFKLKPQTGAFSFLLKKADLDEAIGVSNSTGSGVTYRQVGLTIGGIYDGASTLNIGYKTKANKVTKGWLER